MDLWSRIPVIALVLSPACRKQEPNWPPVECGDVTCLPDQFCVMDADECSYVDAPSDSDSTMCIHVEYGAVHCENVPTHCKRDPSGIAVCIEHSDFCAVHRPNNYFNDGFLVCENGYGDGVCGIDGNGPSYPYCGSRLHGDEESDDFDDFDE